MKFKNALNVGFLLLMISFFTSCSKDNNDKNLTNPSNDGYATAVYVSDAPIDNANVQGVFVTITGVSVNGKAIDGFNKTTVNLSSLQNGNTQLLGDMNLQSGTTSDIKLTLDGAADANGDAPGNYVLLSDGSKQALTMASNEISVNDNAEINETDNNELVLDFDLRKAIVSNSNNEFSFVSNSELSNSVRAVNTLNAGTIKGSVDNSTSNDTTVVYAYKKGTYSSSETDAAGDSGVRFANDVTSAVVNGSGDFKLNFMDAGDYELHLASYSDSNNDGSIEFNGMLQATSDTSIDIQDISVDANSETDVQISVSGLLTL